MDEELRDNERQVAMYICIVMLMLILSLIAYCHLTSKVSASEENWKSKYIEVEATAYCLCKKCTGKDPHDGKTSIGRNAYNPGIAVDPKVIPFRSRIDCSEYDRKPTWCEADDCSESKEKGGKIIDKHIDLRMESHQKAKEFGHKKIKIRVWIKE